MDAPVEIVGDVPAGLEAAIMAALDRDPARRPTAPQLVELLAAPTRREPRPRRRLLLAATALGVALVAVLGAGAGDPAAAVGPLRMRYPVAAPHPAGDQEIWFAPQPVGVDPGATRADDLDAHPAACAPVRWAAAIAVPAASCDTMSHRCAGSWGGCEAAATRSAGTM